MRQRISSLFARATMTLLLAVLTTVTAWADTWPEYISEVKVLGASASNITALKTQYKNAGWTIIDFELNDGAGGDWIYLAYKKASRNSTDYGYITDFYISNHNGIKTLPSSVSYDGKTYYLCDYAGDSYFCSLKGDLNSDAGGDDIHLYYTKENFDDRRVVNNIYFNTTQSGAVKKNGNEGNGYDLNTGCGSSSTDIYMHLTTTKKTNRPSEDPVMATGLTYDGTAKQLITTAATLANGTMKYRIGTSGDWKTNISQLTATNAGDYIVQYYAGSTPYSNVSTTHQTTVSIAKSPNSGVTVSCADILEGNTLTPQLGGNLSNGAVTYKYCTTPDGTYTTTAPTAHGTYYVKATIAGDNNCEEFTTAAATFTIRHDWTLHNSGNSEDDPYVISTTDDLDLLAQRVNAGTDYKNKFFKLGADITYSHTTDWDDATSTENNFTAIGKYSHIFRGTFDGNGKTISGIRISLKDFYNGLFGYIDDGATVKNVIVSDARIIGWSCNGGIAGECKQSTITNCWVKSDVCIGEGHEIGGITGENINGTISGCRSEATLKAYRSDYQGYGGITGYANSIAVSHCVVVGATIPVVSIYRGAVVGNNYSSTLTTNYYSACTVAGVANAANVGRQGADAAGARQAVAIGAATGVTVTPTGTATTYDVSGITAYVGNKGISFGDQLYAGAGETVRLNIAYTVPDGCIFNGFTDGNGNALTDNGDGTYTLTMTGAAATVTPDVTDLWGIADGRDGSTAAKAYLITTPAGLDLLASKVNGGTDYQNTYFELGDDIEYDYTGLAENESNYTAIGTGSGKYFKGKFDGKGHTVSGIRIYMDGTNNQGLFDKITEYAEVKNVTIADARITGYGYVGGIVGWNSYGTIENCHALSTVTVNAVQDEAHHIGGIVGWNNYGTVKGCTSAATVSGSNGSYYVGGIAGSNSGGTTLDCLVLGGTVSGSESVGAIAGSHNDGGTLTNNYHTLSGMGGMNGSDRDGARFAYTFPKAVNNMGAAATTYGTGTYEGITAYASGLAYDGKYYCADLWGGSGTSSDPYIIYNTEGLDKLASNVNSGTQYHGKYFELGANITYDKNTENNFTPIGNGYYYMDGYFDGKGHTISGLNVNQPNKECVGLFGKHVGRSVKNLTLANSTIIGDNYVGGIIGQGMNSSSYQITIENCHVASDVTVVGSTAVGGISGEIQRCTVRGCTSAASVSGSSQKVGGIIGNNNGGTIQDCLVLGGSVSGSNYVGAIAGKNEFNVSLTNNYYTVYGLGGVNGSDANGAQFAISAGSKPDSFGDATTTYGTGKYTGITAYGTNGLEYGGKYYWNGLWGGSGTEDAPYIIYDTAGLDKLATDVNGGTSYMSTYFELGADIEYDPNVDNNFTPIGNFDNVFSGHFDGKGHTVSGLNINLSSTDFVGLFGFKYEGDVKNLTLANSIIICNDNVGGIVGDTYAGATIENCHVASDVTVIGGSNVGGIAGSIGESNVKGCISAATVSASNYDGGIVGSNSGGTIQDCLYMGNAVSGSYFVGTIVGYNGGTLTNNYHTLSGMGGVGQENTATNSDQDGAKFAYEFSEATSGMGAAGTTYGTEECPGITAYDNGLAYGGKYYCANHVEEPSWPAPTDFAVAENGITNRTATLQWTGYSDSYTVSYRTAEGISPVISEGFENGIEGWTLRDCAGATGVSSSSSTHSGNAAFRFRYNTTPPQYLISPELTDISEGMKLEFYYKNSLSNNPETFQVGFSTTDNETSSFTFGDEVTASDTEWHLYSVTIPAGTKYFCIKYTSNDKFYLYIDDIVIGTTVAAGDWQTVTVEEPTATLTGLTPETTYEAKVQGNYGEVGLGNETNLITFTTEVLFPAPTGLAVTAYTATSMTLSWTEKGDATAWQICLDNDENNLIDVTQYPYTLTDLTAETTYNVKVRADYGENKSEWSSDVTFEPTVKTVIGSGTTTSSVVPTKTNFKYSLSQQIYTSAELGDAGLIESIDFFNESSLVERNLNIYMVSTDKDEFTSNTDWISVTDDNLVFSGNVTFFAGVWTTIALDNCFVYDGNSNVVIVVDDNTGSSNNTAVNFRTFTVSDKYQALSACSDNNDFDPMGSLGDVNESNKSKNQIRIMKSELVDCMQPMRLKNAEVGPDFVTLSWQEYGTATEWIIQLVENIEGSSFAEGEVITANSNPYTIHNLSPETRYKVRVRPACNTEDESLWSLITFRTLAANPVPTDLAATNVISSSADVSWKGYGESYHVRYRKPSYIDGIISEEFNSIGSSSPSGWTKKSGLLSDVLDGKTTLSNGGSWYFGNKNDVFDSHAYNNIYGTSRKDWLITPSFTVPGGATVSFDLALTAYSGSNAPAPAISGYDDKFVVLISTDAMNTWTILRQWDNSGLGYVYNDIKTTGEKVTIDLNNYVGETACIAFYGESTASNADNNLHIDNVCIGTTVDATEWQTVNTTEAAANLTGLDPATAYEWQVQSVKDNQESDWSSSTTFTTFGGLELADDDSEKPDGEKNADLISTDDGTAKDVMLVGRTLYKDGKWNTICLPFDVDMTDPNGPLYGATYRTVTDASIDGTTLNITFAENTDDGYDDNTLKAGVPYIIKWDKASDYVDDDAHNIVNPVFIGVNPNNVGVDFVYGDESVWFNGTYDAIPDITSHTMDGYDVLLMGGDNTLHHAGDGESLGAFRAYFLVNPTKVGNARLTDYVFDLGNDEILSGTFPSTIQPGDANGDGNISVTDIAVVVNYILQLPNTNFSFTGADANGDGQVTVTDIGVIVDKILGAYPQPLPKGGEPQ